MQRFHGGTGDSTDAETEADDEGEGHVDKQSVYFTMKYDDIVKVLQKLMTRYTIINMGIEEQSLESVIQRIYSS